MLFATILLDAERMAATVIPGNLITSDLEGIYSLSYFRIPRFFQRITSRSIVVRAMTALRQQACRHQPASNRRVQYVPIRDSRPACISRNTFAIQVVDRSYSSVEEGCIENKRRKCIWTHDGLIGRYQYYESEEYEPQATHSC
jgi:hypothetical protein